MSKKLQVVVIALATSLQLCLIPSASAQINPAPGVVPPEVPPAASPQRLKEPQAPAKKDEIKPESTLEQSSDEPPAPTGSSVRQPAQPAGGKDLLQVGGGKPPIPPRFALTLAGGGARGAAHVGVLKELERAGLKPDFIAGSSIGATIGALYAGGVPVSKIERMVMDGSIKKAYFPQPFYFKTFTYVPTYIVQRFLHMKPIFGLYSGKSIAKFINQAMPPGVKNIEDMPTRFAAIAVNLTDTKMFWITKGDIGSAVRASSTVPALYRPVWTGERLLIDGGLRANLPAEVGKASQAPVVVGVRLHSLLEAQPKDQYVDILKYGERISSIFMTELETKAMDDADIVISPDVEEISVAGFKTDQLARALHEGEIAARKMIPEIREKLRRSEGTASRVDAVQHE